MSEEKALMAGKLCVQILEQSLASVQRKLDDAVARETFLRNELADMLCQHSQKNISNAALHDWMRDTLATVSSKDEK